MKKKKKNKVFSHDVILVVAWCSIILYHPTTVIGHSCCFKFSLQKAAMNILVHSYLFVSLSLKKNENAGSGDLDVLKIFLSELLLERVCSRSVGEPSFPTPHFHWTVYQSGSS